MRKFLSVLLAVVLCLSMCTVAFAGSKSTENPSTENPSSETTSAETYSGWTNSVIGAKDASGASVAIAEKTLGSKDEVAVAVKNAGSTEKFLAAVELTEQVNAVSQLKGLKASELKVHSLLDVYVKSGKPTYPVTITLGLVGVKTTDVVVFVHKAADGYEVIPGKVVKNGQVQAVFTSLSPVVVLVGTAKYTSYADCPQNEDCVLNSFIDLNASSWYHDGVHYCVEEGLMKGVWDKTFAPNDTITRGMVVTMLWRLQNSPVVNYAMDYTDVEADTWYTEAVRWATSEGIVEGIGNKMYAPNAPVTREQLAAMLYRYEQKVNNGGFTGSWMFLLDYPDASEISDWANEAMHWVVMNKVVVGKDGKLVPTGEATRAEAATMFQRFCTLDK